MFVKPAPNPARPGEVLLIRVPPHMQPLPVGGASVPDTIAWQRALLRGDVILAESPEAASEKAAKAQADAKAAEDAAAAVTDAAEKARLTEAAEHADAAAKAADEAAEAANKAAKAGGDAP